MKKEFAYAGVGARRRARGQVHLPLKETEEHLGAVPPLAVHDEIAVECTAEQAEDVEAWLERVMVFGLIHVLSL